MRLMTALGSVTYGSNSAGTIDGSILLVSFGGLLVLVLGGAVGFLGYRAKRRRAGSPNPEPRLTVSDRHGGAIAAVVVVSVLGALLFVPALGGAQDLQGPVRGEPDLDVYVQDPELTPGTGDRLVLQIANDGEVTYGSPEDRGVVTTARNVRVDVDDGGPVTVETERHSIGPVPEDEPREVPIAVRIPDDAETGTHELDVELTYSHTAALFPKGGVETEVTRTRTETVLVEYDVRVHPDAVVAGYSFDGSVAYTDPDGVRDRDDRAALSATLFPEDEQEFRIDDVESTLHVGEEGDFRGTITNVGPSAARNVVVQFDHESPTVVPIEGDVAVGGLDRGESESFRIPIEVGREAEPVTKRFDLTVSYTNRDDELRRYDDGYAVAPIDERRDEFLVSVEEDGIAAGETEVIEVTVTNNLDERVTDVEPKVFTDDPLTATDDEAYIPALEPGAADTVRFEVKSDGDAVAKRHSVSIDVRYDDEAGKSQISDTHRAAIPVVEPDSDSNPARIGVLGVVLAGLVAGVVLRRRP